MGRQANRTLSRRSGRATRKGGYQIMVADDIFRGRTEKAFGAHKARAPDNPLRMFRVPRQITFPPRHRIMVQIRQLVSTVRPQSADFCANMSGPSGRLSQGTQRIYMHPARQIHRTADRLRHHERGRGSEPLHRNSRDLFLSLWYSLASNLFKGGNPCAKFYRQSFPRMPDHFPGSPKFKMRATSTANSWWAHVKFMADDSLRRPRHAAKVLRKAQAYASSTTPESGPRARRNPRFL